MHQKLAIFGGNSIRTKPFLSRPILDEDARKYFVECFDKTMLSRYVGSPVGDFRRYLKMKSVDACKLEDFWSVIGGPYVRNFEARFSNMHKADYAISSNSATSSIISAMIAFGIKPGDEVITSPMSFTATATAMKLGGAKVVFADVNPETYCISIETVEKLVNSKTRVIAPVHLLGNDGDILRLREWCNSKGILLFEDAAQSIYTSINGKYLGTFGEIGVFSFQESKNLATGEGGMALTDDESLAYKLRLIRNHGEALVFEEDDSSIIESAHGYNFRLPDPLAAIGFAQCSKLPEIQAIRHKNYLYLKSKLAKYDFLKFQKVSNYIDQFSPYCVGMTFNYEGIHRNTFAQALRSEGISVTTGFPRLLNENFFTKGDVSETLNAKRINDHEYLGFFQIGYPNIENDMQDIVEAIEKISANFSELRTINHKYLLKREYTLGR